MTPKVTIIIPCYNHSKYIGRAIESVLSQDYDHISLSIVDDASTDDSFRVISKLFDTIDENCIDEENSIKIVSGKIGWVPATLSGFTQNKKQAAARNHAIKMAWDNTDYFLTLDADDVLFPTKVSESVKIMQENPKIGLVYSDAIIHNENTDTYVHEFRRPYNRAILEQENIISNIVLINKRALDVVGLYDEDLPPCEDWELYLRITEHFAAVHIPEPLHQYTVTNQSCTFTVSNEKWNEQRQKVLLKMSERKK